jgi:hypothetical protein
MAAMGETLDSGWTNAVGFSFVPAKDDPAWFRMDRNVGDGTLTAKIASANFNENEFYSDNNGGTFGATGLYINWTNETMSLGSVFSADGANDEGRLAGSYFDATDLWGYESGYGGDTSDKTNASVRLDFENGRIYYDALGGIVYQVSQEANGSVGDTAGDLGSIEYNNDTGVGSGGGSNTSSSVKVRFLYKKRFGIDELDFFFKGRKEIDGTTAEDDCYVNVIFPSVSSANDSFEIQREAPNYSSVYSKLTVDITDLIDDVVYEVYIELEANINAADSASVDAYLRDDITVIERTGN